GATPSAPRPATVPTRPAARAGARSPSGGLDALSPPFREEYAHKRRVPDEVALPEAFGLQREPPEPLQPGPLHPARRADLGPRRAQPRKSGLEPPGRHVGDARLPAQEEHRVPPPRGEPAEGRDEIGAGDPGAERPAEQTRAPDDRHPVRHAQRGPLARDPK